MEEQDQDINLEVEDPPTERRAGQKVKDKISRANEPEQKEQLAREE